MQPLGPRISIQWRMVGRPEEKPQMSSAVKKYVAEQSTRPHSNSPQDLGEGRRKICRVSWRGKTPVRLTFTPSVSSLASIIYVHRKTSSKKSLCSSFTHTHCLLRLFHVILLTSFFVQIIMRSSRGTAHAFIQGINSAPASSSSKQAIFPNTHRYPAFRYI